MKKIYSVLAMCVWGATASFAQWVPQSSNLPLGNTPDYIDAIDNMICWATSTNDGGQTVPSDQFCRTTDGGTTWVAGTIADSNSSVAGLVSSCITAVDANNAWVSMWNTAGGTGKIMHTADGGATWTHQATAAYAGAAAFPNFVHFWDLNIGVTMGDPNGGYFEIYTTVDGGTTWTRVPTANIPAELNGEFGIVNVFTTQGASTIWFGTNVGRIYKSTDYGVTWTVATTPYAGIYIGSIAFKDANNGIAFSADQTSVDDVISTNDGGATWTTIANATTGGLTFRNAACYVPGTPGTYIACSAGQTGGSLFSNDDGNTWNVIDADPHTDVEFTSDIDGFGGTLTQDGGSIYQIYKWTGPVGISEIANTTNANVFPNPATDKIFVKTNNATQYEIVNVTGQSIAKQQIVYTGANLTIDVRNLQSGIYFLRLIQNDGTLSTNKFVKQ
ncbi:MAG TPA: T9SS type A sorting domain-containing protein [Bacteroidia bacterium]|nr:T9SS type A sorting domain-containing protein [Bacteroidia bacterium]